MKHLGGFLGGNNERVFTEACTGGGAGVADGGWNGSTEDSLFDFLLRKCLWTRMVMLFGYVFAAVVYWEVKRYTLLGSIMVCGYNAIDGLI